MPFSIFLEGAASFAQERFWFDDQIRFNSRDITDETEDKFTVYNLPIVYQIDHGSLSIAKLNRVLHLILDKHAVLRTSVNYSEDLNCIIQKIHLNSSQIFTFKVTHMIERNDESLKCLILNEYRSNECFQVAEGKMFRCHLVRYGRNNADDSDDTLHMGDFIVFNFHHFVFDGYSAEIFIRDFILAYEKDSLDQLLVQYIDYSQHERNMCMAKAEAYWLNLLEGYDREKNLKLPYDNIVQSDRRTGHGVTIVMDLEKQLIQAIIRYSEEKNISLFQLLLACYFVFLYKLTQDDDLCFGCINANRFRPELQSLIGLFLNVLPYRLKLDPQETFEKLLTEVVDLCHGIFNFSYLPYQSIQHLHRRDSEKISSVIPFIQTSFQFHTLPNIEHVYLEGEKTSLCQLLFEDESPIARFDLTTITHYDSVRKLFRCSFQYSTDVFKHETVLEIVERYQLLLNQLFCSPSAAAIREKRPMCQISIILPHEQRIMQEMNQTGTYPDDTILACVHHLVLERAHENGQKVSIELDDQCLTYSELLYYSQWVGFQLLKRGVKCKDIVCQCVERSIEMPIGMLAILLCGGVYCPLPPHDPQERLCLLFKSLQAKHIILHSLTEGSFQNTNSEDYFTHNIETMIFDVADRVGSFEFEIQSCSDATAYILFTSGSTGQPKGVMISHKNLRCHLDAFFEASFLNSNDIVIQISQCSFDVHIAEILGALFCGAQLVCLHPNGLFELDYVLNTIQQKSVTRFDMVPKYANTISQHLFNGTKYHAKQLESVRCVAIGGKYRNC